jgi:hypothetical protein
VLFLPLTTGALAAGTGQGTLVYRVDSVSAEVESHRLVIAVKGAVRSGGWTKPHLHVLPQKAAEGDTLSVEFLATPPGEGAAVIQALLPVSARVKARLPRYATTKVTVRAQSNQVTASIIRRK